MASAVAGGLFNAFAFAGAGYLFKYFDKNGYAEEAKRHNLAMEKLTEDREKYAERITDQSSKSCPLSLETPLSESFQCRQLFCKLSKIRQEVKHKLGFETWQ